MPAPHLRCRCRFLIIAETYNGFPSLTVESGGTSHVLFSVGSSTTGSIKHISANGGAWSAAQNIYTYGVTIDAFNISCGAFINAAGNLDIYFGDGTAGYAFPLSGNETAGNILHVIRTSAGSVGSPVQVLAMTAGRGLDSCSPTVNGIAAARIMFTEVTSDYTTISGALKGYAVGDNAAFLNRAPGYAIIVPTNAQYSNAAPTLSLSNSNLTITANSAPGNGANARTATSHTTGLFYDEVTIVAVINANDNLGIGVTNSSEPNTNFLGETTNSACLYTKGDWFTNNGTLQAIPALAFTTGDVICRAVDLVHNKIWFNKNGNTSLWNGDILANQNPATNTGGLSISAVAASAVFLAIEQDSSGQITKTNFGTLPWLFVPPVGAGRWQ
jgi:hypothetical protein